MPDSEPEMIATVNRSKLNEDAKNGVVAPSFEGKATDGTDSLNNHGDLQSNAGCPGGK